MRSRSPPLDEIERKVDNLERAMTELERLSAAMVPGMYEHYRRDTLTPPADRPETPS